MVMSDPHYPKVSSTSDQKKLKNQRLLITLSFALKINQTHRFHFLHSNHMIPSLMHWSNHTQQAHLQGINRPYFSCPLVCHSQESVYVYCLNAMCHGTMSILQNVCLMHSLFYFMWMFQNSHLVAFADQYFQFTGLHAYFSFLRQYRPTNVPVSALEISLHMSRPMHYLAQEQQYSLIISFI